MQNKLRVGLLFGGRSCEHEVSVTSARSVLAAMSREKYDITLIGIDKQGHWLLPRDPDNLLAQAQVETADNIPVLLDYPGGGALTGAGSDIMHRVGEQKLDVVLPILHGPFGEDGTVQGLLELANLAYVGSGVLGSAVGMDKVMARRVFKAEGIPQVDYEVVQRHQWQQNSTTLIESIEEHYAYPVFVKPANMGSSVGVSRATSKNELITAVNLALQFDSKALVEAEAANCREVECAVLGNHEPVASVVGEIIPNAGFYDYNTKYVDDCSDLVIPADLSEEVTARVRFLAVKVFQVIEAWGLSRVDFFVHRETGDVLINEINTMPGFTPISMYPKLWQASGIAYSELIDRLIELALERHLEKTGNKTAL